MIHRWEQFCESKKGWQDIQSPPQTQVIEAHNLIPGTSAQKAKLMALTQAL